MLSTVGLTLFGLATAASAATFYVSPSGGGNGTSPTSTWTLAQANANLQPGDTARLRAGTYNDIIQPSNATGASEAGRITYTNYNGEAASVRGSTSVQNGSSVRVTGDYVTISNLDLSGDKYTAFGNYSMVQATGTQHFHLINCTVIKANYQSDPRLTDGLNSTGIRAQDNEDGVNINDAEFALIEGCTIAGWEIGVYARSFWSTIRDNVIQNNWSTLINIGSYGGASLPSLNLHLLIENNHLGGSMIQDGIQTGTSDLDSAVLNKIVIRNNYFYYNGEDAMDFKGGGDILVEGNVIAGTNGDNDGYAFNRGQGGPNGENWGSVQHYSGGITRGAGTFSQRVIARKNVFYDNNFGVSLKTSQTGWKIYNNTFASGNRDFPGGWNGPVLDSPGHVAASLAGANLAAFLNNISIDHVGCEVYRDGKTLSSGTFTLDYNLYGNATSSGLRFVEGKPGFNGNDPWANQNIHIGLSAWQNHLAQNAPNILGKESHSLVGNPTFVSVPSYPNLYFNYKRPAANPAGSIPTYLPMIALTDRATWFPHDFRLQSNSPAIDAGRTLTTATNSGSGGTILTVADAGYFCDGYSGVISGDTIRIGNATATIASINYGTNTITLTAGTTWSNGAAVSLPYNGSAPDIGAYEFASGGSAPSAPASLTATASSSPQVDLAWPDVATETGYRIQRKVGSGAYSDLTTKAANSTSHNDTTVSASTTYTYQIRAENGNGNSTYTVSNSVTTPSGSGGSPVVYEGESLTVAGNSDTVQTVADTNASNGAYHLLNGTGTASFVTYTVNVASAGTYDVAIGLATRNNRGIYQLLIDSVNQGTAQDGYVNSGTTAYEERALGSVTLSAGTHSFRFNCTGKHASSSAFKHGLDYLKLTPQSTNSVPSITTTSLPGTIAGESYSQSLAATGGDGALVWTLDSGTLPAGLSLSSAGVISGSATTAGTANFTVRVADSDGVTGPSDEDTQALSIVVTANSVPSITTTTLPGTITGESYSQSLAATGGNGSLIWSLDSGTLPAGLSLSSAGVISGSATTAGTANFTVRVADSDGVTGASDEDTQALSIVVTANSVPSITTTSLPAGTVGTAYNQTLAATGGNGSLIWSLDSGSLPAGLSLSSGGVLSGTPTAAGTANFIVRVADGDGNTGPTDENTQAMGITIASPGGSIGFRAAANANSGGSAVSGLQISKPAGVVSGDYLIAAISLGGPGPVTVPSGWTLLGSELADGVTLAVMTRRADSSDGSSYTFNVGTNRKMAGGIVAFSGVQTATPVQVQNGAVESTTAVTNHTTPTISVSGSTAWLVSIFADRTASGSLWSATGVTEQVDTRATGSNAASVAIYTTGPVSTGSQSQLATASVASAEAAMRILAIQP